MVRVYNIIQFKFEGEAKIEIQPHEEAQTRNSLFDGYMFQWCNDGVSPVSFKGSPSFMIWGRVGAHVVSLVRASAWEAESLRIPASRSFSIQTSYNVNYAHLHSQDQHTCWKCHLLFVLDMIH